MRTLVWFRGKDLRVSDHAPLRDALQSGEVIPLFVLDPYFFAPERAARIAHRMQFLLSSLRALESKLAALGSRLVVVGGKSVDVVPALAERWHVDRVVAHRWCEPFARERDRRVAERLRVPFELSDGSTLAPLGSIKAKAGNPYSVYTPFARAFRRERTVGTPIAAPAWIGGLPSGVADEAIPIPSLGDLGIAFNERILPGGEDEAQRRLDVFIEHAARSYDVNRDRMDLAGTSRLSVDLKFGTLSPRTVWHAVSNALGASYRPALDSFLGELLWREFAYNMLWDRPNLLSEPFRPKFKSFPWEFDEPSWTAWVEGRTGYPIIDASSRQLLCEGFVHNRARMISASFLSKHLLIPYQRGEEHYMRYLTDGDWAPNNAGWQWSTGCGCDAQPYFRVFNPVMQGQRFDPTGAYVRAWVPELARLPTSLIHCPWKATDSELGKAGVAMGKTYPNPVVDHAEARSRFLALAWANLASNTD